MGEYFFERCATGQSIELNNCLDQDDINHGFILCCENGHVNLAKFLFPYATNHEEVFELMCSAKYIGIIQLFIDYYRFSKVRRYQYYDGCGYIFGVSDFYQYRDTEFYCTGEVDFEFLDTILPINFKKHYRG